jgi:hypothetical protein
MRRGVCALVSLLALFGCSSESASSGLGEPIRVSNGQFFEGPFPETHDDGPALSQVTLKSAQFFAGSPAKTITGDAANGAQSVAVALENLGSGYWIVPMGAPDPNTPGEFAWAANCDFSSDLGAGLQNLSLAAADAGGKFGPLTTQKISIKSLIPTGRVVASLTWGADADLDLHLTAPSGKELYPKKPNTIGSDETGAALPGSGLLDRDSLAACVPDGVRTENVVFADAPEPGFYTVRVDLFNACKQPAVTFKFTLYVDGQSVLEKTGRLLDIDADAGGQYSGLFVTEFTCDEGTGTCS